MSRKGSRGEARKQRVKVADIHDLPEDERIAIIGNAVEAGKLVAVFVDNEPEKVERYKGKVLKCHPGARFINQVDDLIMVQAAGGPEGATMLQFGPKLDA